MIDMNGVVDTHIHAGPELFRRIGDGVEIAALCREAGLRAVAFKAHHESTVGWVHYIRQMIDGIHIFGGICLNEYVGGINPAAVLCALKMGGKFVWMPTMHAAYHIEVFGKGTYGIRSMTVEGETGNTGIRILEPDGNLCQEIVEIVDMVVEHNAIIGTCHLYPQEIEALVDLATSKGAKIMITHPYHFPREPFEWYKGLTDKGAYLEITAVTAFPMAIHQGRGITLEQSKELIELCGADKCIMASDAGQPFNPWPHEALRLYATLLSNVGVEDSVLKTIMVDNPSRLLGIDIPE
jgi:hypothetical protein